MARLYDTYPGQVVPDVISDDPSWQDYPHFFKVYVPGVGTPFEKVNDPGDSLCGQPRIGSPFAVGTAGLQPAAAAIHRRRIVAVVCLAARPGLAPAVAMAGWALMPYRLPAMDATACRRAEAHGQRYGVG